MNTEQLSKVVRQRADGLAEVDTLCGSHPYLDEAELLRVLARILEGKSVDQAFGSVGDWGYSHPVGKALAAALRTRA